MLIPKKISFIREELKKRGLLKGFMDSGDREISQVFFDSRRVKNGGLFCCITGSNRDGHSFASDAVEAGAVALMCSNAPEEDFGVSVLIVDDVRRSMGVVSSILNGDPSSRLRMIAVTGTNGKSTTTYMIRSIMSHRFKTGLLGTIEYHDGERSFLADRTTPEGPDIQDFLGSMVSNGCEGCVMEASSHGLSQGRLEGVSFNVAVFTNLTQEHLDYHGDMSSYFDAKAILFEKHMKNKGSAVINVDDPYGKTLMSRLGSGISFGIDCDDALVSAKNIVLGVDGVLFDLILDGSILPVKLPMVGRYNVQNALGAAAACMSLGFSQEDIILGLEGMPVVPGRMERFVFQGGICAVVDYAHSPDALENLLKSAREFCPGRLISVFGLGGERFKGNRWTMGELAARMADHIVLTMDNPRGEEPEDIVKDILLGVEKVPDASFQVVIDREKAIRTALDMGQPGDVVVISGKGPESYILIKGQKIPYSDSQAVRTWATDNKRSWR